MLTDIKMRSKVIVITGGTGGIGYQEALMLADMPEKHTVLLSSASLAFLLVRALLSLTPGFTPTLHCR